MMAIHCAQHRQRRAHDHVSRLLLACTRSRHQPHWGWAGLGGAGRGAGESGLLVGLDASFMRAPRGPGRVDVRARLGGPFWMPPSCVAPALAPYSFAGCQVPGLRSIASLFTRLFVHSSLLGHSSMATDICCAANECVFALLKPDLCSNETVQSTKGTRLLRRALPQAQGCSAL